ncbi:MAG: ABC transporter ATP-binding protein [Spirochaetales bacterium]|nr:ABC transporter ATP-binding protein [Spirochaetales bacterium]
MSDRSVFLRLFRMVRPFSWLMVLSVLCGAVGHLAAIGLMGFAAAAVVQIVGFAGSGGEFPYLFAGLALCCGLVRGFCRLGEHYFGHDIAFRLLFDIRTKIFKALSRLAPAKLIDKRSGDVCSSAISDVEYVEIFFAHTVAPIIIGFIVSVVCLVVVGGLNLWYAVGLLPFYLIMGVVVPILSYKAAGKAGYEYRENLSAINSNLLETLRGVKDLILLNQAEARFAGLGEETQKNNQLFAKIKQHEGVVAGLSEVIVLLAVLGNVVVSAALYSRGGVGVREIVISAVVVASSFGPLFSLMFLANSLLNTRAAAGRIFELLDEVPVVGDCAGAVDVGAVGQTPELCGVDFSYPRSQLQILEKFNFSFTKGVLTAISANSGRGKSTILYLMMRFYDPEAGKVVIDGEDLRTMRLDMLRSNISYFTQETKLFNTTIIENIRIADESASDSEVQAAAKKAGIHDFIMSLPQQYQSRVSELGGNFSSGERQRIGLARIFLQDNEVVLLDEPVSNLDSETEQLVMNNLKEGLAGKSALIVSHRQTVIDMADEVVFI